jgi:RNA-directed DNA polymerase
VIPSVFNLYVVGKCIQQQRARHVNEPLVINTACLQPEQKNLSDLLQDCTEEINKARGFKDQLAHRFKRERSIIDNATKQRTRRYVLNLDLQHFFGTTHFGRVRGFFITNRDFALHPKTAALLAQIACHNNVLDIHLGRLV